MRRAITLFLLLATAATAITAKADVNDLVPKSPTEGLSPNARSFQRYGDIPVSLYTGTPNISIPLATLRDGALTLPVELSYHSGGIKPDEHPGWTGLGWTLMLGGAITREVRDLPDETWDLGYQKRCTELKYDLVTAGNASKLLQADVNYSIIDTEPDKFNFNFLDYSGYFILDPKGEWQICCDRPLKVQVDAADLPNISFPNGARTYISTELIFKRFTLTDDRGIQYIFGGDAIDLSIPSNAQTSENWTATAWHLTEIKQPDGHSIRFDYERGDFIVSFSDTYTNISLQNVYTLQSGRGGQLLSPVYLKSVSSTSFSIELESSESSELNYSGQHYMDRKTPVPTTGTRMPYCPYSAQNSMMQEVGWRQLDAIIFRTQASVQFKRVYFNYSSSTVQRLTLNNIEMRYFDSTVGEKYSFRYNNITSMPAYLSGMTDHWGYYNGRLSTISSSDYKETNASTVGYGVLTEITYPTGGKTRLEFEPNYYRFIAGSYDMFDRNHIAGGVRVKRIINFPMDGSRPEIRRFVYGNYSPSNPDGSYLSCGILEGRPVHRRNLEVILNSDVYNVAYESNQSLGSLDNNYGCHIAYPYVAEVKADSGYVVSSFIDPNYPGYRDEWPIVALDSAQFVPHTLKGQYRGKLLGTTIRTATGKTLKTETINYGIIGGSERGVPAFYMNPTILSAKTSNTSPFAYNMSSFYKNYIHSIVETSRDEIYYASGGYGLRVERHKRYNRSGQVVADSTVIRRGDSPETEVTRYSYLWESDPWYSNRHIKNLTSEIEISRNGHVSDHIKNGYTIYNGSLPVLSAIDNVHPGDDIQSLYRCHYANSRGLPVYVTDASGLDIVYLWGSDYLQPVAEIRNADVNAVSRILGYNTANTPQDPDIQTKIATLRRELPHAMVTGYTYEPYLGVTSITDPAGKTTYYDYDWQGRLTLIRDMNGAVVQRYDYETYSGGSVGPDPQSVNAGMP